MRTRCHYFVNSAPGTRLLCAGIAVLLVCSLTLRAEDPVARVILGSDTAMAGGTVLIPIALHAKEGMNIGSLSVEIPVPEKLLRFRAARTSLRAEMAGGELKTEQVASPEKAGISILKVTVAAQKPLPSGVLATLEFRVAEDVGNASKIPLHSSRVTVATVEGKTIADISRKDGEVAVSKTPPTFVNCFFFTH